MDKPKFQMTKQEMLSFNDACAQATFKCPQVNRSVGPKDRDILQGSVKPKDLVKLWKKDSVLWHYGYSCELPDFALEIFERYKLYKARKLVWKHENKIEE
jgi:hypothetical protein